MALLALPLPALAEAPPVAAAEAAHEAPPSEVKQPRVKARLVTDRTSLAPGEKFQMGVSFELDPGWHIYWKDAGDTGQPTELDFGAPDGFDFQEVRWPAPHVFTSAAGTDYGYEGKVLLSTEVRVPEGLAEGTQIPLTATAHWLACKETCIPGKARLGLERHLETRPTGAPVPTSPDADAFAAAAAQLPVPVPEALEVTRVLSRSAIRPGEAFEVVVAVKDREGVALSDVTLALAPARGLRVVKTTVGEPPPRHLPDATLVRVALRASDDPKATGDHVDAVLHVTRGGRPYDFTFSIDVPRAPPGAATLPTESPLFLAASGADAGDAKSVQTPAPPAPAAVISEPEPPSDETSLGLMLAFAFLGGLILNIMPCVLPVLSIKVLGLVQQAGDDRRQMMHHGFAYTAGILVSFGALAAAIVALQAAGRFSGWGFQFQSPTFVAALGAIVFAFGLSLFGVFELSMPGTSKLAKVAGSKHGLSSSFLNGVFATVLATPCTAPFLSPALAFALSQPPVTLVAMLLVVGFGLAFPFLLLAVFPSWSRWLPRPGPWMTTFKQAMGFLLVGTTVWLVGVLARQVTLDALMGYFVFLTCLAVASWIYGHWGSPVRAQATRWSASVLAGGLTFTSAWAFVSTERPKPVVAAQLDARDAVVWADPEEIPWRDFFALDVESAAAEGRTVFIDFTAEWCVTCKANEKTVIDTGEVRTVLRDLGIVPVKADWTNEDDRITAWLQRFKRPGVPMYVILPAGRPEAPMLLPELLTQSTLVESLKKAGPSLPKSQAHL